MDTTTLIVDIIGYIAAASLITGYLLASRMEGTSDTYLFHFLNLFGAVGIGFNAWYHGALPSLFLNIIWFILGLFALIRIRKMIKSRAE